MGRVTGREWRWAAVVSVVVMSATALPYLVCVSSQTAEWRFSGFLIGVEDGNSYLAKMGQGARGAWLFTLPYSSEPQRGAPLFLFYLLLGRLAGPAHGARVAAYHGARLAFGFALLLVSYRFLAEFLPRVRQRRLALVLVAVGGGLGWLLTLLGQARLFDSLPIDFISPEAHTFLVLHTLPHLAAARCLLLLGLLAYLRGRGLASGLALLGAGWIQPQAVLVVWAVMALDAAVTWLLGRRWPRRSDDSLHAPALKMQTALLAIVASSPPVLYAVFLFSFDPLIQQWGKQNVLTSPHPLHYLLGYGPLLIPAALGWRVIHHRWPHLARFVAVWALLVPVLLYAPLTTQRRTIEAFQLPLVVLAVSGLTVALRRVRRWATPLTVALSLPTAVLLLAGGIAAARSRAEPVFHPADQVAVFEWLAANAKPGRVALGSFQTGNVLPAYAPLVAYIGHGPETLYLADKTPRVSAFYRSETSDVERLRLLADGRIDYVLFGPHERALGDFDPRPARYLRLRFSAGDYAVYEVAP